VRDGCALCAPDNRKIAFDRHDAFEWPAKPLSLEPKTPVPEVLMPAAPTPVFANPMTPMPWSVILFVGTPAPWLVVPKIPMP
jgi:hypothetical protein